MAYTDVKVTSSGHFAKGLNKTFYNSVDAMVTDLLRHWYETSESIKSLKISRSMAYSTEFSMTL